MNVKHYDFDFCQNVISRLMETYLYKKSLDSQEVKRGIEDIVILCKHLHIRLARLEGLEQRLGDL